MTFQGKGLDRLRRVVEHAIANVHTELAIHPDPDHYLDDIEDLEQEAQEFRRLLARIDKAIAKESARG